jgi:uncharacterized membrane protein YdjX (TVP38/TMEM64 family)
MQLLRPLLQRLRPTRDTLNQVAVLAAVLIFIYLVQRLFPLQEWLRDGATAYRGWGLWGILLFMATYIAWVLLFMPGPLLGITAGALYGLEKGYLIAAASSVATSLVCFALARGLLPGRARAWTSRYSAFRAVERAGRDKPWTTLFAIHFSPILPFPIGNYMLSLAGISLPRYVLGAWLGMLPGILFYVYVGVVGGQFALEGLHLEGRDFWTFAAGRVGLWLVGGWGIVRFTLLLREYGTARGTDDAAR